jgi:hypothetical protein
MEGPGIYLVETSGSPTTLLGSYGLHKIIGIYGYVLIDLFWIAYMCARVMLTGGERPEGP